MIHITEVLENSQVQIQHLGSQLAQGGGVLSQ